MSTSTRSGNKVGQDVYIVGGSASDGPVTNAQMTAVIGAPDDAAWDGSAPSATLIAIMKAIHAQLVIVASNTTTP